MNTTALHGDKSQDERLKALAAFKAGEVDLLVATDVAARGLDIDNVSHVFNYDIPTSPEVYVHRIGRTGRIGREGVAITLVDPREQRHLRSIESLTRQKIDLVPVPSEDALRARRLDSMREAIKKRIAAGRLEDVKVFVASLAKDTDLMDVAAGAIAMLYEGTQSDDEEEEEAEPAAGGALAVLRVSAGRDAGIRPGDLVGAIAGEAKLNASEIGAIRVDERHSLVEVPASKADQIIRALKATKLRGKKVDVRRLPTTSLA